MRAQGREISAIWLIVTMTVYGIIKDILHALDLGMTSHINANVFIEVMDTNVWGNTQDLKLAGLQGALDDWYRQNKHAYKIQGELGFSRIRTSNDWPKLKCKGAQSRHLLKFTLDLCRKHHDGAKHDQDRLVLVSCVCRYYDIVDRDPMFHPEASQIELDKVGRAGFEAYLRLSREALNKQIRAWKMPAKVHCWSHLCEDTCKIINARYLWCYPDEDLQKLVKEVATTCHPTTVEENTLYKLELFFESS